MRKHILYLASGNSRRFGENKLLFPLQGKPLYLHGLDMLHDYVNNHPDCTLTLVSRYEEIRDTGSRMGIQTVDSPDSEKGVSYTIKAGISSLKDITPEDFLLFMVADQPFFTQESLDRILSLARPGIETASMTYGGQPGNPGLFSASLIKELENLTDDQGGRKVMKAHPCIYVEASSPEELQDVDTREDL